MNDDAKFLATKYSREGFLAFCKKYINGYKDEISPIAADENNLFINIDILGYAMDKEVAIIEIRCKNDIHKQRVAVAKESFKILKKYGIDNALISYYDETDVWRLSLITTNLKINDGKVVREASNPKRYSYLVGRNSKIMTPTKYLIKKGFIESLDELKQRFSVEVVNKQFYESIADLFTQLIGGEKKGVNYEGCLRIKGAKKGANESQEFAVRLLGRLIFCWFLKEKKDNNDLPLIPSSLLSEDRASSTADYYHEIIEPLFFETLNKKMGRRRGVATTDEFKDIPYLNGGLFNNLDGASGDHYKYDRETGAGSNENISIDNEWFNKTFEVLNTYNFTVDENTSVDTDLSIDPEMLGRIFENLLAEINPETKESARKATGSFYTPREIVEYMVDTSLEEYLVSNTKVERNKIKAVISYGIEDDEMYPLQPDDKKAIIEALATLTVLDPACGSGAFPIGVLQKIVYVLQQADPDAQLWLEMQMNSVGPELKRELKDNFFNKNYDYLRKLGVIRQSIFGVDLQPIAIEIARLRCFLSLIVDEEIIDGRDNRGIAPLPNLDFKFVAANTLLKLPGSSDDRVYNLFENRDDITELQNIREEYFNVSSDEKLDVQNDFRRMQSEMLKYRLESVSNGVGVSDKYEALTDWTPFEYSSTEWFDPEWMFGVDNGFDIVIGNPPYVSTKGVKSEDKKKYKESLGFSDDLYSMFAFKGMDLTKPGGILCYITSKTFWTTQTKRNMRDLILSKNIKYIFDTANPFEAAMVDTGIIQIMNTPYKNENHLTFLDGSESLDVPTVYRTVKQEIYINSQNCVIFKPTDINMQVYNKYGKKVKELYDAWWDKIKTSKDIEKNKLELEKYRASLKPGDVALLGCLTEGGQGLATANNGKYIAVRRSTKWASNIIESRPIKLREAIKKHKIGIDGLTDPEDTRVFLANMSEQEIANLFDGLKEKYGRDIFGQGYIYKIIDDNEVADVDLLSEDEKENGIDTNKKYYVPYDKGDKDGNRWYLETPFAIAWTKENVRFLKTNSGKKGSGMPVVRNPQYYFKEGFCWSAINSTYLKCRKK
ncbi:MAG: Eco57I restriction-modification methylase domain-containing protein, partial [Candidatus Saccharibacteria bacterium]|nr:Eco57I restriction-modification methylase domain-containing protein [Candidatus Saccharibacteria bacterium]